MSPLSLFCVGQYTWCVRVFVQFIKERNRRPPPPSDSDSDSETQERLVADPLQATPTELAAGLRAMVRELRRPTGEPYPPDIVHYILLGKWEGAGVRRMTGEVGRV